MKRKKRASPTSSIRSGSGSKQIQSRTALRSSASWMPCTVENPNVRNKCTRCGKPKGSVSGAKCKNGSIGNPQSREHSQIFSWEWNDPASAEKAVRQILPPRDAKKLLQGWSEEYAEESKRETFGKLASAAMEDRGYTAADVAELLGLKAPEERGKDTVERKQRYRPDAEVRGVLFENHVSKQISVEALIQVIARDEDHLQRLRKMYADYRTRFFRRNGATLEGKGLQMRTARELA